ncbi:hypothetical protein Cs7R123_45990 [Catellatospora sp. TT07R-123]|uniref:hypothetical protein n=1 Tax=Catellatospora sp. TT07R-123 TaxID=2733863 RepID=UPI001B080444|nr:hypothetical protein [Catellatospora sp. TT07R-123]GHJ47257.1 hypothetical protein Cs7R123_45990 [Catellatospora sp. TT07R-123]
MARRGYTTTIGKFAKAHHSRRVSEMRMLGEQLERERHDDRPAVTFPMHTGAQAPDRH